VQDPCFNVQQNGLSSPLPGTFAGTGNLGAHHVKFIYIFAQPSVSFLIIPFPRRLQRPFAGSGACAGAADGDSQPAMA
jgi:hypothetical protein